MGYKRGTELAGKLNQRPDPAPGQSKTDYQKQCLGWDVAKNKNK